MTDDLRRPIPTVSAPTRRDLVRSWVWERLPEDALSRRIADTSLRGLRTARSRIPLRYGGTLRPVDPDHPYADWAAARRSDAARLQRCRTEAASRPERPLILVLVLPAADERATALTLDSVRSQTWTDQRVEVLPADATSDVVDRLVADLAPTDLVVVLRAGDTLEPDALHEFATACWRDPWVELVSCDDDVAGGGDPRFRGGWAPDSLLATDLLGRSFALTADAFRHAGGFDPALGPAAWWALVLRADLDPLRVAHVARVLVHLSSRGASTPEHGERIVDEWLEAHEWPARAEREGDHLVLRWSLDTHPRVSIVIPSRHNRPMLERLLPTLESTTYPDFDVLIVDNSGRTDDKEQWYDEHRGRLDLRVMWWTESPFNFSAVNNAGAAATTGEVLVFLNDDTEATDPRWLDDLVGWATRPGVGVVGALLQFDDGTLQHAGVRMGHHGMADHYFLGLRPSERTCAGTAGLTRTVSVVTGACAATRREVFEAVGGFDERLVLTGNDVELALDAIRLGLRNVVSGGAVLFHHESVTRGHSTVWDDTFRSYWRFRHWVVSGDPYFSQNLRIIGPRPDHSYPGDPTPLQLLESHFRRSLDPSSDDDLPTPTELAARFARALRSAAGDDAGRPAVAPAVRTVNWVASHLADPDDPAVRLALRSAALLHDAGVASRFVVLADPDPWWFGSIVSGHARDAVQHEVVELGRTGPVVLPDADVSVAIGWDVVPVVAAAAGRPLRVVVDADVPGPADQRMRDAADGLGLDAICDDAGVAARWRSTTGASAVVVAPSTDLRSPVATSRRPAGDTIAIDVDVSCAIAEWTVIADLVTALRAARPSTRVVVLTDRTPPDPLDAVVVEAPDRRSLATTASAVDLAVLVTAAGHPGRRRAEWAATSTPVVTARPTRRRPAVADDTTVDLDVTPLLDLVVRLLDDESERSSYVTLPAPSPADEAQRLLALLRGETTDLD